MDDRAQVEAILSGDSLDAYYRYSLNRPLEKNEIRRYCIRLIDFEVVFEYSTSEPKVHIFVKQFTIEWDRGRATSLKMGRKYNKHGSIESMMRVVFEDIKKPRELSGRARPEGDSDESLGSQNGMDLSQNDVENVLPETGISEENFMSQIPSCYHMSTSKNARVKHGLPTASTGLLGHLGAGVNLPGRFSLGKNTNRQETDLPKAPSPKVMTEENQPSDGTSRDADDHLMPVNIRESPAASVMEIIPARNETEVPSTMVDEDATLVGTNTEAEPVLKSPKGSNQKSVEVEKTSPPPTKNIPKRPEAEKSPKQSSYGQLDPWHGLTKIRSRDVKIAKDQNTLLEDNRCWFPPLTANSMPQAHVPINLLAQWNQIALHKSRLAKEREQGLTSPRAETPNIRGSSPDAASPTSKSDFGSTSEHPYWSPSPPNRDPRPRPELPADSSPVSGQQGVRKSDSPRTGYQLPGNTDVGIDVSNEQNQRPTSGPPDEHRLLVDGQIQTESQPEPGKKDTPEPVPIAQSQQPEESDNGSDESVMDAAVPCPLGYSSQPALSNDQPEQEPTSSGPSLPRLEASEHVQVVETPAADLGRLRFEKPGNETVGGFEQQSSLTAKSSSQSRIFNTYGSNESASKIEPSQERAYNNKAMAEQGPDIYWYNAAHNAIICNICCYAVPARMQDLHLRDRHKLKDANQRKAAIAAIPCNVNPLEDYADFPVPPVGPLPVQGLEVVKVWRCRICNYVCASSRYAREVHHRRNHNGMDRDLEQAKGQRWFYSGTVSKYWVVQPPALDLSTTVRQYTQTSGCAVAGYRNLPRAPRYSSQTNGDNDSNGVDIMGTQSSSGDWMAHTATPNSHSEFVPNSSGPNVHEPSVALPASATQAEGTPQPFFSYRDVPMFSSDDGSLGPSFQSGAHEASAEQSLESIQVPNLKRSASAMEVDEPSPSKRYKAELYEDQNAHRNKSKDPMSNTVSRRQSYIGDTAKQAEAIRAYEKFRADYPSYTGDFALFTKLCSKLQTLRNMGQFKRSFLWDDFVIMYLEQYPSYLQLCAEMEAKTMEYEEYFGSHFSKPTYKKRSLTVTGIEGSAAEHDATSRSSATAIPFGAHGDANGSFTAGLVDKLSHFHAHSFGPEIEDDSMSGIPSSPIPYGKPGRDTSVLTQRLTVDKPTFDLQSSREIFHEPTINEHTTAEVVDPGTNEHGADESAAAELAADKSITDQLANDEVIDYDSAADDPASKQLQMENAHTLINDELTTNEATVEDPTVDEQSADEESVVETTLQALQRVSTDHENEAVPSIPESEHGDDNDDGEKEVEYDEMEATHETASIELGDDEPSTAPQELLSDGHHSESSSEAESINENWFDSLRHLRPPTGPVWSDDPNTPFKLWARADQNVKSEVRRRGNRYRDVDKNGVIQQSTYLARRE